MGETAEVLVRDFGITRREQDEFSLLSHQRWTAANEAGKFKNEVVPFYVPPKFGPVKTWAAKKPDFGSAPETTALLRPAIRDPYGRGAGSGRTPRHAGWAGRIPGNVRRAGAAGRHRRRRTTRRCGLLRRIANRAVQAVSAECLSGCSEKHA